MKRRVRMTRSGRTYTDSKTKAEMKQVNDAYVAAGGTKLEGPVSVLVEVYGALPKSTPKRIRTRENLHKPDIDNVIKCVMDGLTGTAYDDDTQVVEAHGIKHGDIRRAPYVKVTVSGHANQEESWRNQRK